MGLFSTDADPERKEIDPMTNKKKKFGNRKQFFSALHRIRKNVGALKAHFKVLSKPKVGVHWLELGLKPESTW